MHWKLKLFLKILHRKSAVLPPPSMQIYRQTLDRSWYRHRWWMDGLSVRVKYIDHFFIENRRRERIPIRSYVDDQDYDRVVFFLHGGGWVGRSIDHYDNVCRRMAKYSKAKVFSIGYRLAPEAPFPQAIFDGVDAIRDLLHSKELSEKKCLKIICGDSAGGNMSIGICYELDKEGITLDRILMLYPPLNVALDQDSMEKYGQGFIIEKPDLLWMRSMYISSDTDWYSPLLSPLQYDHYEFMPMTYIITAGYDPFQDDGFALSARLQKENKLAEHRHFPQLTHGFSMLYQLSPDIKKAYQYIYQVIRQ